MAKTDYKTDEEYLKDQSKEAVGALQTLRNSIKKLFNSERHVRFLTQLLLSHRLHATSSIKTYFYGHSSPLASAHKVVIIDESGIVLLTCCCGLTPS